MHPIKRDNWNESCTPNTRNLTTRLYKLNYNNTGMPLLSITNVWFVSDNNKNMIWRLDYSGKMVLVPERSNDKSDKPPLFKPAQRKLRTEGEEVPDLIQMKRTFPGHRYKSWGIKRENIFYKTQTQHNQIQLSTYSYVTHLIAYGFTFNT